MLHGFRLNKQDLICSLACCACEHFSLNLLIFWRTVNWLDPFANDTWEYGCGEEEKCFHDSVACCYYGMCLVSSAGKSNNAATGTAESRLYEHSKDSMNKSVQIPTEKISYVSPGAENNRLNVRHTSNKFEMAHWVEASDESFAGEWWSQEIKKR